MSASPKARSRAWRGAFLALLAVVAPACAYLTRATPPELSPTAAEEVRYEEAAAYVGPAYLARRGRLWVVHLKGSPEQIGYRHARLTKMLMLEGERRMHVLLTKYVPSAVFRWTLTTIARFEYRNLSAGFPIERRAEIFGEAQAYANGSDDLAHAYDRLVYLHGLYDIALAFERSPLLGCTAFAASGPATIEGAAAGHTIVGRNFDLDLDPWFDEDKVVQIVEPQDGLPFVSVAWPGMTGVVTGMNAAGIWVSANGGRASDTQSEGVPVVFTTRAVLEGARTLDEALAIIGRDSPMVSHILLLADGKTGEAMVVERAPGRPLGVIRDASSMVLANHFRTAPLRDDPKDTRIRDITSTLAREARMEELVARHRGHIDPASAASMLRDRSGPSGAPLPIGNRSAIDPLIATHSVIADLSARVLWVSEGPHTLGRYRAIDLGARLAQGAAAASLEAPRDLPADAMLTDGTLDTVRLGAGLRAEAAARAKAGSLDDAAALYRRAIALRGDDHVAWLELARLDERRSRPDEARLAWQRVVALSPESPKALREAKAHAREH